MGDTREVKVIGESGTGLASGPTRSTGRPGWRSSPGTSRRRCWCSPSAPNDAQDLLDRDGDLVAPLVGRRAHGTREYSARLARSFDAFADTGTTVLWLGHVRTEEDRVGLRNRHVHDLATQVAADRDWVVVADLADILGSGDEVAADCLQDDGLHLIVDCLDRVAAWLSTNPPIG